MSDERGDFPIEGGPPGKTIGRYRVVGKLGEGGMGIVYEAEQREPRRRVAVKVVRGGGAADEARVRMFQREAEALARLKHPGIAAIYEAGRTDDGQHFFAMELVRGVTLDRYLERRPPCAARGEIAFRLRLFGRVCEAVHYAHQRAVIHRDLKPSNVFVADDETSSSTSTHGAGLPVVKVLDFGLARISEGDRESVTRSVDAGLIRGTLQYMSPEQAQARSDAIDVRTDVYSLGVMLFEMLAGSRPYDVDGAGLAEALRAICEEPPRALRQARPGGVRFDSDLETIVGKALEKDPERRYSSVAALIDDVERHVGSQPILARPPSALYQLRKFAARNRWPVAAGLAIFAATAAAAAIFATAAAREARHGREIESARADLEEVADFQSEMLSSFEPEGMGRRLAGSWRRRIEEASRVPGGPDAAASLAALETALRAANVTDVAIDVLDEEVLDRAARTVETRFADRPLIAARLDATLAESFVALGRAAKAEPLAERSLEVRARSLGRDDPLTLDSLAISAHVANDLGRPDDAARRQREVAERRTRLLGSEARDALFEWCRLADYETLAGRYDESIRLFESTLESQRRSLGEDDPDTISTMSGLADALAQAQFLARAQSVYREALDASLRVHGPDSPKSFTLMHGLGGVFANTDRLDDARKYVRDALAGRRRVLGTDQSETLASMDLLATVESRSGRHAEALQLLESVREIKTRAFGPDHEETLVAVHNMGVVNFELGRLDEAEKLFRRTIEARTRLFGPGFPPCLKTQRQLAIVLDRTGRKPEAESVRREALAAARDTTLGEDGQEALLIAKDLVISLVRQGRFADALPLAENFVERLARVEGAEAKETLESTSNLAIIELSLGRLDAADERLTRVLAAKERTLPPDDESTGLTRYNLACLRVRQGRSEAAIELLTAAVEHGYRHQDILTDPDLDALRGDARFAALVDEVKRRRGAPRRRRQRPSARRASAIQRTRARQSAIAPRVATALAVERSAS